MENICMKEIITAKEDNSINENLAPMPLIFVCRAIGYNKLLHSDIDYLYESNQVEFYNTVMNNENTKGVYESNFFKELSFINEIYSKKVFCILNYFAYNDEEKLLTYVKNFLIKGWKKVYNHISRKRRLSLGEVIFNCTKKNPNLSAEDVSNICIATYVFCFLLDIEIDTNDCCFDNLINLVNMEMRNNFIKCEENYNTNFDDIRNISSSNVKKIDRIIDKIFDKYGEIRTGEDLINLNFKQENSIEELSGKISHVFSFENLDYSQLLNNLSKKDLEEIIFIYFIRFINNDNDKIYCKIDEININNVDIEDVTKFLINNLYLKLALKEYKSIKEYYFLNNKEAMFIKNKNLQDEINKLNNRVKSTNDNLVSVRNEYSKIEKQNIKLKEKLNNIESNNLEMGSLREFLFNLDSHDEYEEKEIDYDNLSNINGVIVGGTQKWQRRMKETLRNWDFINVENINFDENIVKNAEAVIVYVNYLGHALYYRVVNIANKNNIPIKYIGSNQNVSMVLNQIHQAILEINK